MEDIFKVALMLTAYDQMTRTVQEACAKSKQQIRELNAAAKADFAKGIGLIALGNEGFQRIRKTIGDFAELEDGALSLTSAMADVNGAIDTAKFEKMNQITARLGGYLPGTTNDFYNLFTAMIRNGTTAETILEGTGEAAAYLGVAIKRPYELAGELAVRLGNAAGVAAKDMTKFMDTVARANQVGIDTTDLSYAFARSSGALKNLNIQGLQAANELSAILAMGIRNGMSGETAGTAFASILNSISDPSKMAKLSSALAKYGLNMTFMNADGSFAGFENMFAQFDKIRGLTAGQKSSILESFIGASGGDANLMKIFLSEGSEGLARLNEQMRNQADLATKVSIAMSGLNAKEEAMYGALTNLSAEIGKALAPALKSMYDIIGNIAGVMQEFLKNNPSFAKFIGYMMVAVSAGLMLSGVIFVVKALAAAMALLNIQLALNPIGWIVLAIGAAIVAISALIANWDKVVRAFKTASDRIRYIWGEFLTWFRGMKDAFFNAGGNIMKTIASGMIAGAVWPIKAIAELTKKVRDYLPFSPSKEGAFKDLHRVKISETIAGAIKPGPVTSAMGSLTRAAKAQLSGGGAAAAGNVNVTYNVYIGNNANKDDFLSMLQKHKEELLLMLRQDSSNKQRLSYS